MATKPIYLTDLHAAEQGQKQLDNQKTAERNVNMDRDLRKTGVMTDGPAEDVYDYAGAYDAGTNFEKQSDGGINFPNKFTNDLTVGGVHVATGERLVSREDPDGFGKAAAQGIGNSYTNSNTGQPDGDQDSMIYMALEHVQNGGDRKDFEGPYEQEKVDVAFDIVESYYGLREAGDKIDAINADPPDELVDYEDPNPITITDGSEEVPQQTEQVEEVEVTQDSMAQDATLQQSAMLIAEANGFEFDPTDDVTELLIEEMAFTVNNTAQMAKLVYAYEMGDMDDQTALSYAYALDQYMKLSMMNMDSFQGGLYGMLTDPLTWGSGFVGKAAYSFLGKRAGIRAVIDKLSKGALGKAAQGAGAGVVPGVIEGGAIDFSREVVQQAVGQEEKGKGYNWDEIKNKTAWGSAAGGIFGAGIGGIIGGLVSKEGRAVVKAAYGKVADNWSMSSPVPGSPRAQRGSVGNPRPPSATPPIPNEGTDFGVFMAGNARFPDSYYTRLAVNVSERWNTRFPEGKPISGKQFLQELDSWAKNPMANVEGFSPYEVDNSGLRYWVQSKIDAGEKLTKEQVEDFLFVNEPVVNVNVTGVGDDLNVPGQEYFIGGGSARGATYVRNKITYELFAERHYEMLPGSEYTTEVQAAKEALDRATEDVSQDLFAYDTTLYLNDQRIEQGLEAIIPERPTIDPELAALAPEYTAQLNTYIDRTLAAIEAGDPDLPSAPKWQPPEVYKPRLRDKITDEITTYNTQRQADDAMKANLRQITADIPTDELITMALKQDSALFHAPVQYAKLSFGKGAEGTNYREMRLYFGNDRRGNVQDLAMDRFGIPYDSLTAAQRKRIDGMSALRAKNPNVVEQKAHYPMELNRFGHIRMEDMYDIDGNKVLGVLELQSDAPRTAPANMHPAKQKFQEQAYDDAVQNFNDASVEHYMPDDLRELVVEAAASNRKDKLAKKTQDDFSAVVSDMMGDDAGLDPSLAAVRNRMRMVMGDEALENKELMATIEHLFDEAPEIKDANWEMVDGVDSMLVNRMLQYANENGYKKMMIPFDEKSIEIAEGWEPGTAKGHPKTVARYQKSMLYFFDKDKKLRKRWGIKKLTKTQAHDANGNVLNGENEMWLVEFEDGAAPKSRKALYSAGGPAYLASEGMPEDEESQ